MPTSNRFSENMKEKTILELRQIVENGELYHEAALKAVKEELNDENAVKEMEG